MGEFAQDWEMLRRSGVTLGSRNKSEGGEWKGGAGYEQCCGGRSLLKIVL